MAAYQKLFDHLHEEHNLILLESEMQEIENIVDQQSEFQRKMIKKLYNLSKHLYDLVDNPIWKEHVYNRYVGTIKETEVLLDYCTRDALLEKDNDIQIVGNCANCGVEYHIHQDKTTEVHTVWKLVEMIKKLSDSLENYSQVWGHDEAKLVGDAKHILMGLKSCQAGKDGDCYHELCPQLRDNEPKSSGRHCPIDIEDKTWWPMNMEEQEKEVSKCPNCSKEFTEQRDAILCCYVSELIKDYPKRTSPTNKPKVSNKTMYNGF